MHHVRGSEPGTGEREREREREITESEQNLSYVLKDNLSMVRAFCTRQAVIPS